jgi:single-stranded-DNA-specific exonuclease
LAALARLTGLDAKTQLSSEDIAFTLAPRLNAAGRLGQAQLGVELLTTDSAERAEALAAYLHELNASRESLERSIYLAAQKQIQERFDPSSEPALVLADRGWHPGVIGIVAARLAEKYHRPVVLVAFDQLGLKPGVGSARGVPGFDLHAAFQQCSEYLLSHGGHAAAAGLKIAESQIEVFRAAFCEHAAVGISAEQRVAELWIDAESPFSALTLEAVQQMERLAPFGQANPRPLLCASDVVLAEPPKRVGAGERHLSLRLAQLGVRMRGIAFGGGDWADAMTAASSGRLSVAFRPAINVFKGRRSVDLQVCDWQPARAVVPERCA